jgi:membrane-bound ClpP family serine protease
MSVLSIILIICLGFVLFLLEFLIIPGITVAGIAAFILIAGGVICGYIFHGNAIGNLILLITGVSMLALIIVLLKLKTWKHVGLNSTIDSTVGSITDDGLKAGDEGVTVSKLSPIGKAMINGKLFEVRSDGTYVDPNCEIVIIRIEGNKIYIKTKK